MDDPFPLVPFDQYHLGEPGNSYGIVRLPDPDSP